MKNCIKEVREYLELTQEELSFLTGISRQYLSEIENQKRNVSVGIAIILANALKRKVEEIFFENDVHHGVQEVEIE